MEALERRFRGEAGEGSWVAIGKHIQDSYKRARKLTDGICHVGHRF